MLISLDQIQPVINQFPSACQDFSYKIVIFRVFYCFFNHIIMSKQNLENNISHSSHAFENDNCCTEGLGLAVGGACLLLLLLSSSLHVHACHSRGVLHAHWVCRVFSGL
jgi:hypothetical protein